MDYPRTIRPRFSKTGDLVGMTVTFDNGKEVELIAVKRMMRKPYVGKHDKSKYTVGYENKNP